MLIAAFLTWIAGFVDAVGFLALSHIYTANMSGNSVAVGIQFTLRNWPETIRRIWPVIGYVLGLLCCRLLIEFGARRRIRSIASITWLCEILLLLPVCASHSRNTLVLSFGCVGLLALAMGIQNATLTHFSSLTLNTGFVTGTLVKFAEQCARYITWLFDQGHAPKGSFGKALAGSYRQKSFQVTVWLACIWIAYVAGACCGAFAEYDFGLRSLVIPVASLGALIMIDLRNPLGIPEEKAQDKLSA